MTLWRKTRTEMAGAVRSLRYDLGQRDGVAPDVAEPLPATGGPDVTSTGMNTFGGAVLKASAGREPGSRRRPPRRIAAVAAFGSLAVVGAAGSYFAVVNGLGGLLTDRTATAEPYPLAIGEQERDQVASNAGLGRGAAAPAERPVPAVTVGPVVTGTPGVPLPPPLLPPAPPPTTVTRTVTVPGTPPPTSEGCGDCNQPPVPTPTSVPSTTPSPTDSASPDPTDSPSSPAPTGSASSEPSGDVSPSGRRAHRRN